MVYIITLGRMHHAYQVPNYHFWVALPALLCKSCDLSTLLRPIRGGSMLYMLEFKEGQVSHLDYR